MKTRALLFATLLLGSMAMLAPSAAAVENGDPFMSGASTVSPGNPCGLTGRAGGVSVNPVAKRVFYTSRASASIANMSDLTPFGCTLVPTSVSGVGGWSAIAYDAWHAQVRFWVANGTKVYGLSGAGALAKGPLDVGADVASLTMDSATQDLVVLTAGASFVKRYGTSTLASTATVTFGTVPKTLTGWEGGYLTGDASQYVRLLDPAGGHTGLSFRPHTNHQDEFYQPYQMVQPFLQIALDTGGYAPRNALWTLQESTSIQCVANCPPSPVYECVRYEGTTCLERKCVQHCTYTGPPPTTVTTFAPSLRAFEVFRPCPPPALAWQPCGPNPCAGVVPPIPTFVEPQQGAYVRGEFRSSFPGLGVIGYGGVVPVRVTDAGGLAGKTITVTGLPAPLQTVGVDAVGALDARTQPRGHYTLFASITDEKGCHTRNDTVTVYLADPVLRSSAQNLRVQGNLPLHLVTGTLPAAPADTLAGNERFDLVGPFASQPLQTDAEAFSAQARHGPYEGAEHVLVAEANTAARRTSGFIHLSKLCYDLTGQFACNSLPLVMTAHSGADLTSYASVWMVPRQGYVSAYGGAGGAADTFVVATQDVDLAGGAVAWYDGVGVFADARAFNTPIFSAGPYEPLPLTDEYHVGDFHAYIGKVETVTGPFHAEVTASVLRVVVDRHDVKGEIVFGESYAGISIDGASLLQGPPRLLVPQDDFETGADAPATASGATTLTSGAYAGSFEGTDRADAFVVDAWPGEKVKVVLQQAHRATVLATPLPMLPATDVAPRYMRLTLLDPLGNVRDSSFLAVDAHPAEVELNVDDAGSWTVLVERTDARTETAPYALALAVAPVHALAQDAPGGVDAGGCSAALPLVGAAAGGLDASDPLDTYAVTMGPTGRLVATLTMPDVDGQDFDLALLSPACALLAQSATGGPAAKGAPERLDVAGLAPGVYYVQVVRTNGIGNYVLGVAAA